MAAETGIAVLVVSIPFFFLAFGRLLTSQENRFAPWLRGLFNFCAIFSLTFVINLAAYYASVESMTVYADTMINMLVWVERIIYFVMALYGLSLLIDAFDTFKEALRRKHG